MIFLINSISIALFLMEQPAEAPEVKYNVAFIAAIATVTAAIISASISVFTAYKTRKNQSALQREQAALTQKNQTELAELQSILTGKNQEGLEVLRASLGEQGKERDAKRAYEYDARQKLYAQCEPLLFQLADLADHGYHRVYSLARSAHLGKLPRWLNGDGYYLCSTMYRLLAPLVILRLIQQRLTFVDLTLDAHIAHQYRLLKLLYLTFTDPFDFAAIHPKIEYNPDADDWKIKRELDEQTYWRQGLYLGSLDNAIDALLVMQNDQAVQWKTYGQFESEYKDKSSDTYRRLGDFADVLHRFHPRTRPVLWRMLCTQTLIYKQILESQSEAGGSKSRIGFMSVSPSLPPRGLDWRCDKSEVSEEEALLVPQNVAQEYLRTRLPEVFGKATH
jgi:hypothetical protein